MTINLEVDLRGHLLEVRDQGGRSTCLAHALSVAHEQARRAVLPLSPEYLHHFATKGAVSSGASFAAGSKALATEGQPLESDCPYRIVDPPAGWHPESGISTYKRASKSAKVQSAEIESLLRSGQVPVLGISLPESFFNPSSPWVLNSDGPILALHAVVAVGLGHCDAGGLTLIRNSWGETWGMDGHAWLNESFLQRHLREMIVLTEEVVS